MNIEHEPCIVDLPSKNAQWPFQDLEVPTIHRAYVFRLRKEIPPQNMALDGTVPPF